MTDENNVIQRRTGVVLEGLWIGSAINIQKNVGSLLISPVRAGEFFGKGPEKIVLNEFDGVLKSGEMLVVLGRPGSGCSTLLKTLMGELDMRSQSEIQYNCITQERMLKKFKGEIVYNQEVQKKVPRTYDEFEKYWKWSTHFDELEQGREDHKMEFQMGGKTLETYQIYWI